MLLRDILNTFIVHLIQADPAASPNRILIAGLVVWQLSLSELRVPSPGVYFLFFPEEEELIPAIKAGRARGDIACIRYDRLIVHPASQKPGRDERVKLVGS